MTKPYFVIGRTLLLLLQCQLILSQNFQQLSYANAELGQSLIRPHSTTPITTVDGKSSASPPPQPQLPLATQTPVITLTSTTAKPTGGFLSSLRNIFSRTSTTTTTTTSKPRTVAPPLTGIRLTVPHGHIALPAHNQPSLRTGGSGTNIAQHNSARAQHQQQQQQNGNQQNVLVTSTTQKAQRQDFPPLVPPRRNRPSASSTAPTPTTTWTNPSTSTERTTTRTTNRMPANTASIPAGPVLSTAQSTSSLVSIGSRDNSKASTQPLATDAEMEELTELLFRKSSPNLFPFITVNLQGKTRSSLTSDDAPQPLLSLNETILEETPTIVKMRKLFDNYELDSSINEYVSPIERQEENEFIDAVLATPVMKAAMKFLQNKGVVTADPKTHFDLLKTIWFNLYSRGQGKIGSSAFEHVFMNELKNMSVSGLHNWIWFYYREGQSGTHHNIDYKGYMRSLLLGNKGQIVKYRFSFDNIAKPVNAMFIGTLPELEMALYTVCFEASKSECRVSLDGNKFVIRTYPFRYRGKRLIGSAFPEI